VARPPRFDWPGAVHHVMARGIERRPIFRDDYDRTDLLDRLREVVPDCGARVFAWAFMPNHIHLVVRSGHASVSQVMQRVTTGYAVRFNVRHDRVGYLFQNRFRSRLVTGDDDLQGLVRYVHLNPVEGGLVPDLDALDRFPWSGQGALMGRRAAWEFEDSLAPLTLFDADVSRARERLRRWMEEGSAGADSAQSAPPDADDELARLIDRACRRYGVPPEDVIRGARTDRASCARAMVCHVASVEWKMSHARIAPRVGVSARAVARACSRGAELSDDDPRIVWDPREES
jgi:putative transposase